MNIKLRWGGDWDRDTQVKDNSFDDLLHFELIKWNRTDDMEDDDDFDIDFPLAA